MIQHFFLILAALIPEKKHQKIPVYSAKTTAVRIVKIVVFYNQKHAKIDCNINVRAVSTKHSDQNIV